MNKAVCSNYSYLPPFFLFIYHSSHLSLLLSAFLLLFIQGRSSSLVFILSVHFAWTPPWQSALFECSLPHPHSIRLILLCGLVSFSWGLHFACSHIPGYLCFSSSCPSQYLLSQKLHSSIFPTSPFSFPLLLATVIKLLPESFLPAFLHSPVIVCSFPFWHIFIISHFLPSSVQCLLLMHVFLFSFAFI